MIFKVYLPQILFTRYVLNQISDQIKNYIRGYDITTVKLNARIS